MLEDAHSPNWNVQNFRGQEILFFLPKNLNFYSNSKFFKTKIWFSSFVNYYELNEVMLFGTHNFDLKYI
jgi:hypothetical protein